MQMLNGFKVMGLVGIIALLNVCSIQCMEDAKKGMEDAKKEVMQFIREVKREVCGSDTQDRANCIFGGLTGFSFGSLTHSFFTKRIPNNLVRGCGFVAAIPVLSFMAAKSSQALKADSDVTRLLYRPCDTMTYGLAELYETSKGNIDRKFKELSAQKRE